MRIKIDELREKVSKYLSALGFEEKDVKTFVELIIEQELVGNQFSAVGELAGKHARLSKDLTRQKEEIVSEKPAIKLIKGNGRLAPIITAEYLDEVIASAKKQGIYALGIYDSTYNEFFDVFCRRVANQNCIAIIVENGGPQGVVPFGGKTDVTGTNPIAYGIPTNDYPIIFDASTASHAYGRIKQAKERHEKLPNNAYVNKDGEVTTDPNEAYAVLPFGGFKGFGINLLVDVLSGSLVRGRSGLDQPLDSQRYIGTLIIVIDPSAFGEIKDFKDSKTKLAKDIMAVEPVNPDRPVRVPGYRGSMRKDQFISEGIIEIDDLDWKKFDNTCKDFGL